MAIITTPRLVLRHWRESDYEPFVEMNSDLRVMEFFPKILTRAETEAFIGRIQEHFEKHGFGLWAAEEKATQKFLGYVGLAVPSFESHFTPCVEIGWRLAYEHWGRGFATEGAQAVVHHAFTILNMRQLVSFTVPANLRSRRVMEKLGMSHDPGDDFDHPVMGPGNSSRRHVLYRLTRTD